MYNKMLESTKATYFKLKHFCQIVILLFFRKREKNKDKRRANVRV